MIGNESLTGSRLGSIDKDRSSQAYPVVGRNYRLVDLGKLGNPIHPDLTRG